MRKVTFLAIVEEFRHIPLKQIREWLGVPRSTSYRWLKQPVTVPDSSVTNQIRLLCQANKYRYGYRKITALLRKDVVVNHKRVQRIMQQEALQCRIRPKRRSHIGQPTYVAPNHVDRNFKADKPLQKLVTDITYLPFGGKVLYLSSVLDLYNSEIVAYTLADHQRVELVLDTLNQLELPPGAIVHSDQGSVYTSIAYQTAVKEKSITMSMSRKGTPADNAPIESFHSTLKSETFYSQQLTCTTTAIVEQLVREYILSYNTTRIMTKLNNQSPVEFRRLAA